MKRRIVDGSVWYLNQHLKGWANYYRYGYLRKAFREINSYTRERMTKHLKWRSQRAYKVPEAISFLWWRGFRSRWRDERRLL